MKRKKYIKVDIIVSTFYIEMMKDDVRHKTATQRKNEAKEVVVLDQCHRDLDASIKKWWQKVIWGSL